jgi:dTMP kinase
MNVYFTSEILNGDLARNKKIIALIKKLNYQVITSLQFDSKNNQQTPAEIFLHAKESIDKSDCVVAEVTNPSSGVGGEIVYTLIHDKPVLTLFYKDAENKITPMLAGNPSEHLYLEHYDDDNLEFTLKHFFAEVKINQKRKGKLIVIDGGDGSGKATQSELLSKYLQSQKYNVKYFDFPRYYSSFHGQIVGRFLTGEFGALDQVSPYLASLAYALDRASAKEEMDDWLTHGGIILSNRYATSSMAHQSAKLPENKRQEFIDWLDELEYKVHKIPREDVVVYLYVPWKIGYDLTLKKADRAYLKGKMDIAEKDLNHRKISEEMYLQLTRNRKNWITIDCVVGDKILPKAVIHEKIIAGLKAKKII